MFATVRAGWPTVWPTVNRRHSVLTDVGRIAVVTRAVPITRRSLAIGHGGRWVPDKRYLDWDVPDPSDQPIDAVRDVRDDIQAHVNKLLRELGIC
jgi:protein-tyrosine-phosphatase